MHCAWNEKKKTCSVIWGRSKEKNYCLRCKIICCDWNIVCANELQQQQKQWINSNWQIHVKCTIIILRHIISFQDTHYKCKTTTTTTTKQFRSKFCNTLMVFITVWTRLAQEHDWSIILPTVRSHHMRSLYSSHTTTTVPSQCGFFFLLLMHDININFSQTKRSM